MLMLIIISSWCWCCTGAHCWRSNELHKRRLVRPENEIDFPIEKESTWLKFVYICIPGTWLSMWTAMTENPLDPTPHTYVLRWCGKVQSFGNFVFLNLKCQKRTLKQDLWSSLTIFLSKARWQFEPSAGGKSMNISQVTPNISRTYCLRSLHSFH